MKSGVLQSCHQPSQIQWIADTRATDHMSLSSSHFQTYSTISELSSITISKGGVLHVTRIGDVNLDKLGIIKKVLHAPNLYKHLISLQKLVDDNVWQFILDSDDCFLCEKVFGRKISSFRREVGLLVFNDLAAMCLSSIRQRVVAEDRIWMLHMRMGPPYF